MSLAEPLYERYLETSSAITLMGLFNPFDYLGLGLCMDLPDWWHGNGNRLFLPQGVAPPSIQPHVGLPPPQEALVVIAGHVGHLIVWGSRPTIAMGEISSFHGSIACGSALVVIGRGVLANGPTSIDARNGGRVLVGHGGLWAPGVELITDDMHAIRNLDGKRVNRFGGQIVIEDRVWLGKEVMVRGGATIGHDSIVGARAVVTRSLPAHSVAAGAPATVIREGVTWTHEDLP